MRIGAACVWPNGKVYFFKGNKYFQYDIASDSIDEGFPKKISEGWPGVFGDNIDAVAVWPEGSQFEGKAYFFKGDQYIRFDIASNCADPGYPQSIGDGNWPGLFEGDIDAVCVWPGGTPYEGKAYFFRGDEYIRYDIAADRADPGYPCKIGGGNWPGLFTEDIDAACVWPEGTPYAGKIYFFRGGEYLRFDARTNRADAGYPQRIDGGNWGGFTPSAWIPPEQRRAAAPLRRRRDRVVDAGCVWPNGKAYFFRGDSYVQYDIATEQVDAGF